MNYIAAAHSDASFLLRADEAAQAAWGEVVQGATKKPEEGRLLADAIRHPYLRHLFEMEINNSVTALGARKLLTLGYVDIVTFLPRASWCDLDPVSALELTPHGIARLTQIHRAHGGREWFIAFQAGISEYACRDGGEGVCLGREHLESAIACEDDEILRLVVDPSSFCFDFLGKPPSIVNFSQADRLENERFWSPQLAGRTSAKVITSSFDFSEPVWRPEDDAEFDDIVHVNVVPYPLEEEDD